MGALCLVLVVSFSTFYLSNFEIILMGKKELCTLTVFLLLCDSHCSVALPRDVVGWSAVWDYCIS